MGFLKLNVGWAVAGLMACAGIGRAGAETIGFDDGGLNTATEISRYATDSGTNPGFKVVLGTTGSMDITSKDGWLRLSADFDTTDGTLGSSGNQLFFGVPGRNTQYVSNTLLGITIDTADDLYDLTFQVDSSATHFGSTYYSIGTIIYVSVGSNNPLTSTREITVSVGAPSGSASSAPLPPAVMGGLVLITGLGVARFTRRRMDCR